MDISTVTDFAVVFLHCAREPARFGNDFRRLSVLGSIVDDESFGRRISLSMHQVEEGRRDGSGESETCFAVVVTRQNLEFHGVMRFYFQESGQKVATKCIRVSSTATTRAVIEALIEKFHPDMRMLSGSSYSLWEVHENGEERKLQPDEKPLLVQLNWHKDDREGRFLLRHDDMERLPLKATENSGQMKRKLSGKKRRELKKQGKEIRRSKEAEDFSRSLYSEVPATTFTRTISNPEVVMRKRRERKLQQKLREIGDGTIFRWFAHVEGAAKTAAVRHSAYHIQ
ncbi:unnamed protein product [Soboliphyme baturini]|uniref:Ras-associating domain-containing protein n=1 Tax=Soboliphyme baturini TaxID=241478 RepID=A0A183J263_9BILA|nr:unnamed protein product [Soboliphyme baturini]